MQRPTKESLSRSDGIAFCAGNYDLHPNRRLYKYCWRVFTADCPWEGDELFQKAPRLSTAAFVELEHELTRLGAKAFVYNSKRPRHGHGLPLDPNHPRWKNREWAPSWDDDPDLEWTGHK
jgi:hypothetical protein